ncbi:MAG: SRPBCC domain-containing protein [Actinobacteria bacterium]|nr:SRPBCC domain-containing protein [Actinomycetota bacterium]
MAEGQVVERDILLPVPADEVWAAITDDDQLAAWFGAEARLELRPGGRATFRWPDGTTRNATVEVVEAERLLILRWFPFADDAHGGRRQQPVTTLSFRLEATSHGTRLRVAESATAQEAFSDDHLLARNARPDAWHNSGDLRASAV